MIIINKIKIVLNVENIRNVFAGKMIKYHYPYVSRDIPKIIKFKATNSLRVSCLFCIFKHSPQKTV
ncbi:hypothetical protein DW046_15535 [Bacteroides stercoris]|nr:hypothetical protein DW046_15535 [Bacteroides stercoris]